MIPLTLFALFGIALFLSVVLIALKSPPTGSSDPSAAIAVAEIVTLDSLSLKDAHRLLEDSEYRMLRSNPALGEIAVRFRIERRELALLWISLLLSDLRKLSKFRAFLLQRGVPTRMSEEIHIGYQLVCAVVFLNFLRVFLRIFGPFALQGLSRRAKLPIEGMSRASAKLLNRLPSSQWQRVAREWQACSPSSQAVS